MLNMLEQKRKNPFQSIFYILIFSIVIWLTKVLVPHFFTYSFNDIRLFSIFKNKIEGIEYEDKTDNFKVWFPSYPQIEKSTVRYSDLHNNQSVIPTYEDVLVLLSDINKYDINKKTYQSSITKFRYRIDFFVEILDFSNFPQEYLKKFRTDLIKNTYTSLKGGIKSGFSINDVLIFKKLVDINLDTTSFNYDVLKFHISAQRYIDRPIYYDFYSKIFFLNNKEYMQICIVAHRKDIKNDYLQKFFDSFKFTKPVTK